MPGPSHLRPFPSQRAAQLRAEGKGTWEINRIMARENLEYEIADIEDISDVRRVLSKLLERIIIE